MKGQDRERWRARSVNAFRPGFARRRPDVDPDQLELDVLGRVPAVAMQAAARRRLVELLETSGLSQADFARWVLGRSPRTVTRYLAGAPIPHDAARWLRDVESITVADDLVFVSIRRGAIGPRWGRVARYRGADLSSY